MAKITHPTHDELSVNEGLSLRRHGWAIFVPAPDSSLTEHEYIQRVFKTQLRNKVLQRARAAINRPVEPLP